MKYSERIKKGVQKGWGQYLKSCDVAHRSICEKVLFEFSIGYQPSDGPVLEAEGKVAPLDKCVEIIGDKGILTWEDYKKVCI